MSQKYSQKVVQLSQIGSLLWYVSTLWQCNQWQNMIFDLPCRPHWRGSHDESPDDYVTKQCGRCTVICFSSFISLNFMLHVFSLWQPLFSVRILTIVWYYKKSWIVVPSSICIFWYNGVHYLVFISYQRWAMVAMPIFHFHVSKLL